MYIRIACYTLFFLKKKKKKKSWNPHKLFPVSHPSVPLLGLYPFHIMVHSSASFPGYLSVLHFLHCSLPPPSLLQPPYSPLPIVLLILALVRKVLDFKFILTAPVLMFSIFQMISFRVERGFLFWLSWIPKTIFLILTSRRALWSAPSQERFPPLWAACPVSATISFWLRRVIYITGRRLLNATSSPPWSVKTKTYALV